MNSQEKEWTKEIADNNIVSVELKYRKGGMNYFSGQYEERGYELIFSHYEKSRDGWKTMQLTGSRSFRILIKPTKRFNQKTYDKLSSKINSIKNELLAMYEKYVKGYYIDDINVGKIVSYLKEKLN